MAVPQVAIVGRPNVGKSSIFNWLAGRRLAIVDDMAGVTRDQLLSIPAIGPKNADQVLAAYAKAIEKRAARRG